MTCPHCGAEMHPDHDDRQYCTACGLAGPRDVLEALAARLAPADPAKVQLLRAFVIASSRAAWKLATAYVRREVSPRAEYESLFRAAGLRVGFETIDTDGELKVIDLMRDLKLTTGGGDG
jgi:hypothetical protein